MTITESFVEAMLAWLNDGRTRGGVQIDESTLLFASGAIDSIKVLELLAWTEQALGRHIDDCQITLENFSSVRRIADVFASDEVSVS